MHSNDETSTDAHPLAPRMRYAIAGFLLLFLLAFSLLTKGRVEEDEARHFLISLFAWTDWRLALDVWGRPGYTIPASFFAMFGRYEAARVFSAVVTWVAAIGAWRGASLFGMPHAWLAAIIFCASPTTLQSAAGAFTEPVFAAALVWGLVFYQEGRYNIAALVLGWTAVTRLEGVLMLPLYGILFLMRRQWSAVVIAGIPFALWVLISGVLSGDLMWVKNSVPYRVKQYGGETDYFPGYFLYRLVQLMSPCVAAAAIVGSIAIARLKDAGAWLAAAWMYFAIQEGAYAADYGSSGYTRFLVGAAPAYAVFALAGLYAVLGLIPSPIIPHLRTAWVMAALGGIVWSWGSVKWGALLTTLFLAVVAVAWYLHRTKPRLWIAVPACLLLAVALFPARFARPMEPSGFDRAIRRAVNASRAYMEADPRPVFMSGNYQSVERLAINPHDEREFLLATPGNLHHAPQGTIFVWDGFFTERLHHVTRQMIEDTGYFEVIRDVPATPHSPQVVAYRKMVPPPAAE